MAKVKAVAYLRTSSATNVGRDKDSDKRQMAAITAWAKQAGYSIVLQPFYDAAVSGADAVDTRPGFLSMMAFLAQHADCRTILVETASRFARDLIVQETAHKMLRSRGIELIAVDSPESFVTDTPTAELVRQILGAVSQFEKSMVVSKLRVARERKRAAMGKCEGRKSHAEVRPEVVALAKQLRGKRKAVKSYRLVSQLLAERGHLTASGKPFGPSAIQSMLSA
ncbi:MAG: recombinase family protein [Steroidobacter sp.]